MLTFESLPLEIRNLIYQLLLLHVSYRHGRWIGKAIRPVKFLSGRNSEVASGLHPAILGVSRHIHNEAGSVLYGSNMFHFRNERNVHLLKQWFDNVGVGNLQWLRRVRVSAASSDGARFDQQRLFDMKRTFTKCLDMFAVRCSNVQELDIKEDASHNKGCPSGSEQVLILTKVTGVKRLRLFGWTSLSAAEQMARLVVLREHSKVEVRRTQAEPTTKNPQTGCYPGWDVMFETINSTDEVAMDRALRSWEEFERILTTDRNA